MATSKIITKAEHSFGTGIRLGTTFTTLQKDGYIVVNCDYRPNNYVIVFANDNEIRLLSVTSLKSDNDMSAFPSASCFVKAGMKLYARSNDFTNENNTAFYYPLV